MTVFRPTLSGETPHQRVEKFFQLHLGQEQGKILADACYNIGQESGTDFYDIAVDTVLEEIGKTEDELLEFIGLIRK